MKALITFAALLAPSAALAQEAPKDGASPAGIIVAESMVKATIVLGDTGCIVGPFTFTNEKGEIVLSIVAGARLPEGCGK